MPYSDPAVQRAYQAEWRRRRRAEWIAANGPCVDCGTWEDLEVDHVDPGTKITHNVWSWSKSRQAAELAKCVARCRAHHKQKSNGEKMRGADNGRSTLSNEQVSEIKKALDAGAGYAQLGRTYSVGRQTIYKIAKGLRWRGPDAPPAPGHGAGATSHLVSR